MRPLIVKTARMQTDCLDVSLGLKKMDESRPEYRMLDAILTDDMARAALKMGVRRPTTPEQAREHRCLGCGVTRVDPNRCIGCGICTTRCMFGAIRLERSHPEFENYVPYERAKINTVLNGVRQTGKIVIREVRGKK